MISDSDLSDLLTLLLPPRPAIGHLPLAISTRISFDDLFIDAISETQDGVPYYDFSTVMSNNTTQGLSL